MNLWENIRSLGRRDVAGVMIPCLLIATVLWYFIKLSYTYTASVPVDLSIDGERIRVHCMAEAPGYRIIAHRLLPGGDIDLSLEDAGAVPSVVNANSFVLDPLSLQQIISEHNSDLRLISVDEIPEIVVNPQE